MNTINLITSIALLACILTPAYVLYFLKYVIGKQQEKHNQKVDKQIGSITNCISSLDSGIEKIQFDEIEKRIERVNELQKLHQYIEQVEMTSKMHQSISDNNFDNINVQQDYLRRTLDKHFNELKKEITLAVDHSNFNTTAVFNKTNKFESDIDALQSLNIIVQDMYKRMYSKEFAISVTEKSLEVIDKYFDKEKREIESIGELQDPIEIKVNRRGRPKKQNTEPTIHQEQVAEEIKVFKPKTPKKEAKRVIRTRELQQYFREVTKLTFRGYVIKFGQEAFHRERLLVYKKLYYQKFMKPMKADSEPIKTQVDVPLVVG